MRGAARWLATWMYWDPGRWSENMDIYSISLTTLFYVYITMLCYTLRYFCLVPQDITHQVLRSHASRSRIRSHIAVYEHLPRIAHISAVNKREKGHEIARLCITPLLWTEKEIKTVKV